MLQRSGRDRVARAKAIMHELREGRVDELCDGRVLPVYTGASEHLHTVLERDADRYGLFLEILRGHARATKPATMRILELGANPYVCSYLFLRSLNCDLILGGHPVSPAVGASAWQVRFRSAALHQGAAIPLRRFNVESDRFPFADGCFDAVVCGELIEHMVEGPDHLLMEMNRVLRPGGLLLLSTPNSVSLSKSIALLRGRTIACGYSRQGVYGRHHREYTLPELEDLLAGNHLAVAGARHIPVEHRRSHYSRGLYGWLKWRAVSALLHRACGRRGPLRDRGEVIVVHALKNGPPVRYRPAFLFEGRDTIPMIPSELAQAAG